MPGTLIATSDSRGLRWLGSPGQRSWEMLQQLLQDRLGVRHAGLLAEPVPSSQGDTVDWYAAREGSPVPIGELSSGEADLLRTTFAALKQDVLALADELAESSEESMQLRAEALRNAMQFPGDAWLYGLTGGDAGGSSIQPVLVNWARTAEGRAVVSPPPPVSAPPPPPPVSEPPARTPKWPLFWWPGWILVALLSVAIFWWLIPACGLRPAWLFNFCPPTPVIADQIEPGTRTAVLEQRVAELQRQIDAIPCAPVAIVTPPPVEEPEVVPEELEDEEIEERLEEAGAQEGDFSVALSWSDKADLDLHVTCPSGSTVSYSAKNVASCRGTLDVDANAQRGRATNRPVENIFFEDPLPGAYQIHVKRFKDNGAPGPHPFKVRIKFAEVAEVFEGQVSQNAPTWRHTYNYQPAQ